MIARVVPLCDAVRWIAKRKNTRYKMRCVGKKSQAQTHAQQTTKSQGAARYVDLYSLGKRRGCMIKKGARQVSFSKIFSLQSSKDIKPNSLRGPKQPLDTTKRKA